MLGWLVRVGAGRGAARLLFARPPLLRRVGVQRERMNPAVELLLETLIDGAVPLQASCANNGIADQYYAVMRLPRGAASVSGAFVQYLEMRGRKGGFELLSDAFLGIHGCVRHSVSRLRE